MAWYDPSWGWRMPITLDQGVGLFSLVNFQVPLALTAANAADVFTLARSDGADLLITAADGTTLLDFWLQDYDNVADTATLWVKIPTLTMGNTGTVYLYFANAAQSSSLGSYDDTFQKLATSGLDAVFHLDDGSGSTLADALAGTSGTVINGAPTWGGTDGGPFPGTSQVFSTGSFVTLNGTTQCIELPVLTTPPTAGALSFWFKPTSSNPTGNVRLFSLMANATGGGRGNGWDCYFDGSSILHLVTFTDGVGDDMTGQRTTWTAGQWYFVVFNWGPTQRALWIDGRLEASSQTYDNGGAGPWAGTSAVNKLALGAFYQHDAAQLFNDSAPQSCLGASFDEVGIHDHQLLPEEIAALYYRRQYARGMHQSGRWTKQGAVVSGAPWTGGGFAQEPSILSEAGAWKLWCSGTGGGLGLLTSSDGLTWTPDAGDPLINPGQASCFVKFGSTYYTFFNKGIGGGAWGVHYSTSSDAVTWAAPALVTDMTTTDIGETWIGTLTSNVFVFLDPITSLYTMTLEGQSSVDGQYRVGVWTSPNLTSGGTWTPYAGNPLSDLELAGSESGYSHLHVFPDLLGDGRYHAWLHCGVRGFGPSRIAYSSSDDLHTWEPPLIVLDLETESIGGDPATQIADASLLEVGGTSYLYTDVDVTAIGGGFVSSRIDLATFSGSLTEVVVDPPFSSFGTAEESGMGAFSSAFSSAFDVGAGGVSVSPADCLHGHSAESPTVAQVHQVAPEDALHGHTSDSPNITQAGSITPDGCTHAHTAESPNVGIQINPDDCLHSHTVESPTITQVHGISPADCLHSHLADSPVVSGDVVEGPGFVVAAQVYHPGAKAVQVHS